MKQKRILVTGATGFIGRQSLEPLLNRGFEVHALYVKKPIENDTRVIWHRADLLEEGAAARLCTAIQATHLLHLAWYVNPKDYKTALENKRLVETTRALVRAFCESGGTRAVLAGTCMEYDWSLPQEALVENVSQVLPATPYGIAKNETRLSCEEYAKGNGLSLAWGRIFFLYGPHEAAQRLVPAVMNSLLDGTEAQTTSGEQIRDYSFVSDVAGAFCALVDSPVTGCVNIGSGVPIALKDIVLTIADILKKRDLVRLGALPTPLGEPARIVANVKRLREEVGWTPQHDLRKGLEETIQWWKEARGH